MLLSCTNSPYVQSQEICPTKYIVAPKKHTKISHQNILRNNKEKVLSFFKRSSRLGKVSLFVSFHGLYNHNREFKITRQLRRRKRLFKI